MITPQRSRLSKQISGWRQGQGPNLLLIHGVGMRAEYWSNITDQLQRSFTLTLIDMPGHGQSPVYTASDPGLTDYTDTIADLLQERGEPTFVVGHSMGALIALDIAVRYSSLITGIGVFNGVYRRSAKALSAINARVAELSSSERSGSEATLVRWFGETPTGINAVSADACREWLADVNQAGYRDAYRAFANADAPTDDQLKSLQCPALFMTGSLEPNSTPAMSRSMSELVPHAHCVIVDEARHMMSMTHGQVVVQAITDFFLPQRVAP